MRFILVLSLWVPFSANAVLGGTPTSNNLQHSTAQISKQTLRYVEHSEGSQTVREYIGADGMVYAVSWAGPKNPNLSALLGDYNDEYLAALDSPTSVHPRRSLASSSVNLDVHRFGHMGALHGVVIIKSKLPDNLKWLELL